MPAPKKDEQPHVTQLAPDVIEVVYATFVQQVEAPGLQGKHGWLNTKAAPFAPHELSMTFSRGLLAIRTNKSDGVNYVPLANVKEMRTYA